MATIPLNIDEADLKKIDYLVKKGLFKNRSQALRNLLLEQLNHINLPFEWEEKESDEKVNYVVRKLLNIPNQKLIIKSDKPASQLIQEERERY